jgi:hypothetical protein
MKAKFKAIILNLNFISKLQWVKRSYRELDFRVSDKVESELAWTSCVFSRAIVGISEMASQTVAGRVVPPSLPGGSGGAAAPSTWTRLAHSSVILLPLNLALVMELFYFLKRKCFLSICFKRYSFPSSQGLICSSMETCVYDLNGAHFQHFLTEPPWTSKPPLRAGKYVKIYKVGETHVMSFKYACMPSQRHRSIRE